MAVELQSGLRATGILTVEVLDAKTGEILERQVNKNLCVTAGRNLIRDLLNGDVANGLTHFAIGTGAAAVTAGDTTLATEVFRDTVTSRTKDSAKLTVKYYLASGSANGNTLREAGIFNNAAAGTMYARVVLSSTIAKTSSIAVTFTWDLTWST